MPPIAKRFVGCCGGCLVPPLLLVLALSWQCNQINAAENLLAACESGDYDEAKVWLARGADPNFESKFGLPLIAAVKSGNVRIVNLLLVAGANPSLTESDCQAAARFTRDPSILKLLDSYRLRNTGGLAYDCRTKPHRYKGDTLVVK
jgi:hypothetical protein